MFGWAIRQNYTALSGRDRVQKFLLGRYYFSRDQQKHMRGYKQGVFKTRREARDWLTEYKAARRDGDWQRNWCRHMTVVKVKISVEEVWA